MTRRIVPAVLAQYFRMFHTWIGLFIAAAMLAGCTIFKTPDGHRLWSAHGTTAVQAKIGTPDMIEERESYYFGPYTSTTYTYLDRGYTVGFVNHLVRSVRVIADQDRADVERRVRAYREEVPKLPIGAPAHEAIAVFGPPNHVDVQRVVDGITHGVYAGTYQGELPSAPGEQALCYWAARNVCVVIESGHVVNVRPLTQWDIGVMRRSSREGEP